MTHQWVLLGEPDRVWPNLDVDPRQYRFRIVNGSNTRFYNLAFSNQMPFP